MVSASDGQALAGAAQGLDRAGLIHGEADGIFGRGESRQTSVRPAACEESPAYLGVERSFCVKYKFLLPRGK